MVAGTVAIALVTTYLIPDSPKSPITPVSTIQFWFGYIFPVPRMFEFCLGMIVARMVLTGRFPRMDRRLAALSLVGGYALALATPFVYGFVVATIVPIALVIGTFAMADLRGDRTGFAGPTAQWLGEISFGFYICQGVVVFYGRSLLPAHPFATPLALVVVAGELVATLLVGWALFSLVERPAMQRWARSRRAAERRPSVREVSVKPTPLVGESSSAWQPLPVPGDLEGASAGRRPAGKLGAPGPEPSPSQAG